MFRFLTIFFAGLFFSSHLSAVSPQSDDLFQRLKLKDSFLNGPVCSVKRKGVALTCDLSTVKNDPAIQSGKVIFFDKNHNGEGDHGNQCAEIVSRLLPKGRSYLKQSETFVSSLKKDLRGIHNVSGHPILVVGYSIYGNDEREDLQAICKELSPVLRHKIVVLAAGNHRTTLSGKTLQRYSMFEKIFAKLSPQERKNIIFVGATHPKERREILDSRYSNIAGEFGSHFILAPSKFVGYSPRQQRQEMLLGTSFAAPVITGLVTRALLANPKLTSQEVVGLLFQTANKRNLVSTGNFEVDRSFYGHGVADAQLFFKAAHAYNRAREKGKDPRASLSLLLNTSRPNVFKDFRKNIRDKLDILNLLNDYAHLDESDFKGYKNHVLHTTKQGPLNIEKLPSSHFTLDDFEACSQIFNARKLSDDKFTSFALSKFPLSSLSQYGGSLLTKAISCERKDLVNTLLSREFDIHLRGKDGEGEAGSLPIHAAAWIGDNVTLRKLLQRGGPIDVEHRGVDPLLITLLGEKERPEKIPQRLSILDMLFHQGANFHRKVNGLSLIDLVEEGLGKDSPLTQRVKYYAENGHHIKKKPLALELQPHKKPTEKPMIAKRNPRKEIRKQAVKGKIHKRRALQRKTLKRRASQKKEIKHKTVQRKIRPKWIPSTKLRSKKHLSRRQRKHKHP